jgi:hypothetical protein
VTVEIREHPVPSRARDTHARVAPTRIGTLRQKAGGTTTTLFGLVAALLTRYAATEDAWDSTPSSPREVLEYTRAGDWVPGEKAAWLEALGKAYGYVIALPGTVAGLALVWTVQRPTRVGAVGLIVGLAWLSSWLLAR